MKCVHPNLKLAASLVALSFLSSAAGCKNQQGAVAANPFFGPNRVPPPATRTLLPGQAQPYYQGDPLPVSHNGTRQPAPIAQASAEAEVPSADGSLAWTSPSAAQQKPATGPVTTTAPPASSSTPPSVVASNEPSVAVPNDGNSLRFASPEPTPAEPQMFTPNNAAAIASTQTPTSVQPSLQLPTPPSSRDIVQAAYTEPVITNSQTPSPDPWRSPQLAQASVGPASLSQANNYVPQPIAAQPIGPPLAYNPSPPLPLSSSMPPVVTVNTMDVRLREVPSPPMPRIRIPGANTSVPMIGNADGFRAHEHAVERRENCYVAWRKMDDTSLGY